MEREKNNNANVGCVGCLSWIILIVLGVCFFRLGACGGKFIKGYYQEYSSNSLINDLDIKIDLDKANYKNSYDLSSKTTIGEKTYYINSFSDLKNFYNNLKLESQYNKKLHPELISLTIFLSNLNFQYLSAASENINNEEKLNSITENIMTITKSFAKCYLNNRSDGLSYNESKELIKKCISNFKSNSMYEYKGVFEKEVSTRLQGKQYTIKNFYNYKKFIKELWSDKGKDSNDLKQEAIILIDDLCSEYLEFLSRFKSENRVFDIGYNIAFVEFFIDCYIKDRREVMPYNETMNLEKSCGQKFINNISSIINY